MIELLVVLCVVGFIVYMVNAHLPIAPPFKMVINFVVVMILIVWVLNFFGLTNWDFPRRR